MARAWLYILDDAGNPTPALDVEQWIEWFAGANGQSHIAISVVGRFSAVTHFVGLDKSQSAAGGAILYETQIRDDERPRNEYTTMRHSATRAEAEAAHARTVADLEARLRPVRFPRQRPSGGGA